MHEFEERIGRAYAATTLDELRELTLDLPPSAAVPAEPPRRRSLLPGNRPFAIRFESDEAPAAVISAAMRSIAPNLIGARYQLQMSEPTRLVFRRSRFPFWSVAAAVLIPIFGLLALAAAGRETSEIVASANALGEGRTAVDVFGVASMPVRRAMLQLDR